MTITPSALLSLPIITSGTESGTWGDVVDNGLTSYLDIAIAGGLAIAITTADVTLANTAGTSLVTGIVSTTAQYAILNISGAKTAARSLILPSSSREYTINNAAATGGFLLTVKGAATTGVTLVDGENAVVAWNGTDYVKVSTNLAGVPSINGGQLAGLRNRIINGAMPIDQRNDGASVTPTTDAQYTLDRWNARLSVASKFSVQQGTATNPAGFPQALLTTSLATTSLAAGDFYGIAQYIEGFNTVDFAWGSADAKTVTLSFWVRSSLTGTFGGAIRNGASNRSYPFTYAISVANTWEYKTATIPGDTAGTWATDSTCGPQVIFGLGVGTTFSGTAGAWAAANYISATGAVSVVGTNAAVWYVTGVQLELGTVATTFEQRPYGLELMLCQRYYEYLTTGNAGVSYFIASTQYGYQVQWSAQKRVIPTVTTTYYSTAATLVTASITGAIYYSSTGFFYPGVTTASAEL